MDGRINYLDVNQYAQVFSNRTYFSEIYPTAKKADAGKALKTFVIDLFVREKLTVDDQK